MDRMQAQNPFFASSSPQRISKQIQYFEKYTRDFSTITFFEITSFFKASVLYVLLLFFPILFFFLSPFSLGILLTFIGLGIAFNLSLPLPNVLKRRHISSRAINSFMKFWLNTSDKTSGFNIFSLTPKQFSSIFKTGGIAIALIGLQLIGDPTTLLPFAIALLLITLGALLDQYLWIVIGCIFTIIL